MVPFVEQKMDQNGRLTDEKTREKIRDLLAALIAWTKRLRSA